MDRALKSIRKHLLVYKSFLENSLASQMEYRANFFINIAVEIASLCMKALYLIIVYDTGVVINGITPDAMSIFIGTYTIITGIFWGFIAINFIQIPKHVREGTLDLIMVKPVSLLFMLSFRNINFGYPIPSIVGGVAMLAYGWGRLGIAVSLIKILGYIFLIFIGMVITYAVFILPEILGFWIIKVDSVHEMSYALWDFNNMPMGIYNRLIKRIGVFSLPIFVISNFPAMFVLDQLNGVYIVWVIVCPIVWIFIMKAIWGFAIRNYSSAHG